MQNRHPSEYFMAEVGVDKAETPPRIRSLLYVSIDWSASNSHFHFPERSFFRLLLFSPRSFLLAAFSSSEGALPLPKIMQNTYSPWWLEISLFRSFSTKLQIQRAKITRNTDRERALKRSVEFAGPNQPFQGLLARAPCRPRRVGAHAVPRR
jgi:hypothetical protein